MKPEAGRGHDSNIEIKIPVDLLRRMYLRLIHGIEWYEGEETADKLSPKGLTNGGIYTQIGKLDASTYQNIIKHDTSKIWKLRNNHLNWQFPTLHQNHQNPRFLWYQHRSLMQTSELTKKL